MEEKKENAKINEERQSERSIEMIPYNTLFIFSTENP
jgi:uncharacterized membrane protein